MIAYHFPPFRGSSGLQRTLRFAQHLPTFGWKPIVLTIVPRAYEASSCASGNEVPAGVEVVRAFGLDAARHLGVFGRYPRVLATPDRWATWRFAAVAHALHTIRRRGVTSVWSTFPIATAHAIGRTIKRHSGLPWIAEFRDPMWQGDYPPDPAVNHAWRILETEIFRDASAIAVTTPGAAALYKSRFPDFPVDRLALIENGYDEETFQRAEATLPRMTSMRPSFARPLTLLHSGVIYKSERDPKELFAALASLKAKGVVSSKRLQVVLRATGDDREFQRNIETSGISDIVSVVPQMDYLPALQEMLSSDGLLILQASNCNAQVPAKLYEYLRARRPILALTDPAGDTAKTLDAAGVGLVARLDSRLEIESALVQFLDQLERRTWRPPSSEVVAGCSRLARTEQLARLLDRTRARD